MRASQSLATVTLMAVAGLAVLLWLRDTPKPYIGTIEYQFDGLEVRESEHPLSVRGEVEFMNIELPMILTRWQSRTLHVKPDDCLEELSINDRKVELPEIPYCDYSRPGRQLDLSEYLITGFNHWKMRIRDTGGDMGIRITPTLRGWVLALDLSIVLLVTLYGIALWRRLPALHALGGVFFIVLGGAALRTLYVLATQYLVRGHDTGGHIDYIHYVYNHFAIPPAHQGWEYHQAPLYYIESSLLMHLSTFFGMAKTQLMGIVQVQSLLFGIGLVVTAGAASFLLFSRKSQNLERTLYCAILASIPGIVYLSGRITNNTLYMLLAALSFVLLLRWWKSNKTSHWYTLCIVLGLTALTKVSGLAIIAAVGLCWLLRNIFKPRSWRHGFVGGLLIVLIFGWYPLSRLGHEGDTQKLVKLGNTGMHGGLQLPNTKTNYFTFNPVGIVQHPFNNPWGDEQRRQYFWEYFYRSAYFGEFGYDDDLKILARGILIFSFPLLLLMLLGMAGSLFGRDKNALPVFTCFLLLLLAAFLYRFNFPYSANQDFRQSIVVIFPALYFAIRGFSMLKGIKGGIWLQKAMLWVLVTGIFLNITFTLMLYFYR